MGSVAKMHMKREIGAFARKHLEFVGQLARFRESGFGLQKSREHFPSITCGVRLIGQDGKPFLSAGKKTSCH